MPLRLARRLHLVRYSLRWPILTRVSTRGQTPHLRRERCALVSSRAWFPRPSQNLTKRFHIPCSVATQLRESRFDISVRRSRSKPSSPRTLSFATLIESTRVIQYFFLAKPHRATKAALAESSSRNSRRSN